MKQSAEDRNSEKVKSLEYFSNQSVELSLTYCDYEKCSEDHHFRAYAKNYYVLYVINCGDVMCRVDDTEYYLEDKDAILVYPGEKCYFESSMKAPWAYVWFGFTGVKAEACTLYSGFSLNHRVCKLDYSQKMEALFGEMFSVRGMTFANGLRRNGLLQIIFSELIRQYESLGDHNIEIRLRKDTVPEYVKTAISYITENYMHEIKINEMADHVGVNRSYLATSFKKATGCSPKEYLLNLRMENAQLLLNKTEMPVNAIANAVGYSDQLAFSRIFKKYCGASPTEYRASRPK